LAVEAAWVEWVAAVVEAVSASKLVVGVRLAVWEACLVGVAVEEGTNILEDFRSERHQSLDKRFHAGPNLTRDVPGSRMTSSITPTLQHGGHQVSPNLFSILYGVGYMGHCAS
jgi:hypothetical protein